MTNSENLRKIIEIKPIVKVGGAYDALSAKLVETSGFDAIWAGSFAISATHALPDASILTMTDFLRAAENMVDSCNIPVIADCDTGFGGPANVSHAVKKYEFRSVVALKRSWWHTVTRQRRVYQITRCRNCVRVVVAFAEGTPAAPALMR